MKTKIKNEIFSYVPATVDIMEVASSDRATPKSPSFKRSSSIKNALLMYNENKVILVFYSSF